MIVYLLNHHGANVNVMDEYGNTPLMYAAINNDIAVIAVLLKHHADASYKNKQGISPLDVVKDEQILEMLYNSDPEHLMEPIFHDSYE